MQQEIRSFNSPNVLRWLRFLLISLAIFPVFYGQTRLADRPEAAWLPILVGFLSALAASALRPEKQWPLRFPPARAGDFRMWLCLIPAGFLGALVFYSVYTQSWGNRVPFYLWVASILTILVPFWLFDRTPSIDFGGDRDSRRPLFGTIDRRSAEAISVGLILFVAFLFRFVDLERYPVALHNDEANCGLMGRQILEEWRAGALNWFKTRQFMQFNTLGFLPTALFQALFSPNLFAHRLANVAASMATLPLFYFLVRDLFGRTAGVAALALAATSHFSVHWSRSGIHCGHTAFLAALCAWILWKGIRTGKTKWLVLFGVVVVACFVTYNAALVVPLWLFLVASVYCLFSSRFRRRFIGPLTLSALVASIVFAPLLGVYLNQPETLVTRSGSMVFTGEENSIRHMKSLHGEDYLPAILKYNLDRTLLVFNKTMDTNLQYGFRLGGLLDDLTASAFILGLAVMLPRILHFTVWPFLLFILLNILLGSFLTMDAPQFGRLAGLSFFMMVPPALWAREVSMQLKRAVGEIGGGAGACMIGAGLVLIGAANLDLYFNQHDKLRGNRHEVLLHAISMDVRDGGPRNKTFVLEGPFPTDFVHRSHAFVAEGNPVEAFGEMDRIRFEADEDLDSVTVVLPLDRDDLLESLRGRFPNGVDHVRKMKGRTPPELYILFKTPIR